MIPTQPTSRMKHWRPEDDWTLRERFHTDYLRDIAKALGCSVSTVSNHARRLGLRKANPTGRNHDARAFIRSEFPRLSYQEMAERTGLHRKTITLIARELGLERTREQSRAIRSRRRKELIRRERGRIIFGLEQKTGLKVVSNKPKIRLRGNLRRAGYQAGDDGHTFYFTDALHRIHYRMEANGRKFGFKFMPLPTGSSEATESDSASPALSANG